MNGAEDLARTERRLAEVESLQRTLDLVCIELRAYRETLGKKIAWLRQADSPSEEGSGERAVLPFSPTEAALVAEASQVEKGSAGEPGGDSAAERRASQRRGGNLVSILISDVTGTAEALPGWVTDRSSGGLGVWSDEAAVAGTILCVRTAKAAKWTQVVVKHCRPDKSNWVLGCAFVNQPGWDVLRMFG